MKPFTFFYLLYRPTFVRMDISQTEKDPGGQMTSQARTRTRQCSSSKNCSEADIRKAIPRQQAAKQARPTTPGLCRVNGKFTCYGGWDIHCAYSIGPYGRAYSHRETTP